MGPGHGVGQRRRSAQEAHLPAGQGEHLAGRADLDRALAHAGIGDEGAMAGVAEHHMFPDLIADGDDVVGDAVFRQQRQVGVVEHRPGRIVWVVEHDKAGALGERRVQRRAVETPVRRRQADQFRHAAGLADDRQVAVIDGLEDDHLVAGTDQAQERRRQRLGGAGGDDHLVLPVQVQALYARIVGGRRLAQLRQARRGRILIVAVQHGLGRLGADGLRTRLVRETLAEVDRAQGAGQAGHLVEDGGRKTCKDRIGHRTIGTGEDAPFQEGPPCRRSSSSSRNTRRRSRR